MKPTAIFTYLSQESTIDYEGHLSLLMFTAGCNFQCRYCHNPELIPKKKESVSVKELQNILFRAKNNWIDAVSISGGEPTMSPYLEETLRIVKSFGFHIKLDTQGSFPDILQNALPYLDYVAMDYKMPMEKLSHVTQTKISKNSILRSIHLLKESGVDYEIRTTVVPGLQTDSDMIQICKEIAPVQKFVLQHFVPRENLPDPSYQKKPRTPLPLFESYQSICKEYIEQTIIR
ncbi:MAG: anaerobic ribonucleoside-triphosphate reductase activating protein [Caldisericia bacterium]|nr:anaerobic ribonucleoside-triphosphate reductase activating protein [Caldisericia bacterium]